MSQTIAISSTFVNLSYRAYGAPLSKHAELQVFQPAHPSSPTLLPRLVERFSDIMRLPALWAVYVLKYSIITRRIIWEHIAAQYQREDICTRIMDLLQLVRSGDHRRLST